MPLRISGMRIERPGRAINPDAHKIESIKYLQRMYSVIY
jgi:hypothetical protein